MDGHADGEAFLVTTVGTAPSTGLVYAAVAVFLALHYQHLVADASSEKPLRRTEKGKAHSSNHATNLFPPYK